MRWRGRASVVSSVRLPVSQGGLTICFAGRRRWGDDDSDDDELTIDSVRKARAARNGGDEQSMSQMQAQTSQVSRAALSSTQRALKQLEETTQMAGATLEKVHDQVITAASHASLVPPSHCCLAYQLYAGSCRAPQNAQMDRIDDDLDEVSTARSTTQPMSDNTGYMHKRHMRANPPT